ncbi:hypothetical protein QBE55_02790 [Eubacteriales bacterium mix99]
MRIKVVAIYILLIVLFFAACNNASKSQERTPTNQSKELDTHAQIFKVYTDLSEKDGWWVVPRERKEVTFFTEVKNTDTVLFWATPTGTETWTERELIGYDIDGSDGWSFTWEFGDRSFHDRIYIQALGNDNSTQAVEIIQVTSE